MCVCVWCSLCETASLCTCLKFMIIMCVSSSKTKLKRVHLYDCGFAMNLINSGRICSPREGVALPFRTTVQCSGGSMASFNQVQISKVGESGHGEATPLLSGNGTSRERISSWEDSLVHFSKRQKHTTRY